MSTSAAPADAGVLWLAALQRALDRAAHDVKDALNGVSVNLEVVRSRAGRADAAASAVAPFADAAAHQLERLTALLDAVLALGRRERGPVDVGITLRRVAAVCSASNAASDARVTVREALVSDARTGVPSEAVRLALTAPLLDVVASRRGESRDPVVCELAGDGDALVVRLLADRAVTMPADAAEALRALGVRWTESANELSIVFPRA
jgi:signal transduction histidine kinase